MRHRSFRGSSLFIRWMFPGAQGSSPWWNHFLTAILHCYFMQFPLDSHNESLDSTGTIGAVRSYGSATGRLGGGGVSHGASGSGSNVGIGTEIKCKKPVLRKDLSQW